jgi:hypothetical protein
MSLTDLHEKTIKWGEDRNFYNPEHYSEQYEIRNKK